MNTSRKKRGRKARYALYNGREVIGLYCAFNKDKSIRNFYYLDENQRQVSCTADITEAVRRYRKAQSTEQIVQVSGLSKPVDYLSIENVGNVAESFLSGFELKQVNGQFILSTVNSIPKQEIIKKFVELLKENKFEIAELAGIPQLAHLEDITPLPKSLLLEDLLNTFLQKKITDKYKYYVKKYWQEFSNIMKKKDVRNITYEDFTLYEHTIYKNAEKSTITNKQRYINNKFEAVRAVLRYARKKNEYKKDINRLLEYFEQITFAKGTVKQIEIMSKKQFNVLLKNSENNVLARCVLLLGHYCPVIS